MNQTAPIFFTLCFYKHLRELKAITFKNLSQLNKQELHAYRAAVQAAFPPIILNTAININRWQKIEKYFPSLQQFGFDENQKLIGFINTVTFNWNQEASLLPQDGWDWMVDQSIKDYEAKQKTNSIGGLQIIVCKEFLGKGYSKILIQKAKELKLENEFQNLFIPIRPTFKHHYAQMPMSEYLHFKKGEKLYDPWIRTHLKCGATVLNICENSMNVKEPLAYWEKLTDQVITSSGNILIDGALYPVKIDLENKMGEYREPNIWISY